MRISYESGDKVNIISGDNAGKQGMVMDAKVGTDSIRKLFVKVDGETNPYLNSELSPTMDYFIEKNWPRNALFMIEGSDGIWKREGEDLIELKSNEKRPVFLSGLRKIIKGDFGKILADAIDLVGKEFWIYNKKFDTYAGPMHFKDGKIYTAKNVSLDLNSDICLVSAETVLQALGVAALEIKEAAKTDNLIEVKAMRAKQLTDTGLSQRVVAQRLGVSQGTVSRWVRELKSREALKTA